MFSLKEAIDDTINRIKDCLELNNIEYDDFTLMGPTPYNGWEKRYVVKVDGVPYYYDEINNVLHH